jgi:hypothetical protein
MSMSPTDSDLPIKLKRLQFPVLLSFAMTINKSHFSGTDLSQRALNATDKQAPPKNPFVFYIWDIPSQNDKTLPR